MHPGMGGTLKLGTQELEAKWANCYIMPTFVQNCLIPKVSIIFPWILAEEADSCTYLDIYKKSQLSMLQNSACL